MLISTIIFLNWCILWYLIFLSVGYIFLFTMSIRDIFMRDQEERIGDVLSMMKLEAMPPVSVIMATYNEENNITESIDSVLNSTYPHTYLIIVNDGSTDNTVKKLIERYQLHKVPPVMPQLLKTFGAIKGYYISEAYPNITLIDKEHHDKSDCLNIGINACRTPLFITMDADSLIEPEAVSELLFYLATRPHAVAVGGGVYILNGCKWKNGKITEARMPYHFITGIQACEYMRSFLFARAGWNPLNGSLSFSGTATLFDHQAILDIGGFDVGNPANDFEIIVHLHEHKLGKNSLYQIGYTPAASVWTDVPDTLKSYWHQRTTWQIGTLRSLMLYKHMFFNPRYGITGLFTYPFFLLGETLGPLVELLAYVLVLISWWIGILDGYLALLFFLVCLGFITLLTMATVLMSLITYNKYGKLRDVPWMLFLVVIETFGFRQYGAICRTIATFRYFFGKLKFWEKNKDLDFGNRTK